MNGMNDLGQTCPYGSKLGWKLPWRRYLHSPTYHHMAKSIFQSGPTLSSDYRIVVCARLKRL